MNNHALWLVSPKASTPDGLECDQGHMQSFRASNVPLVAHRGTRTGHSARFGHTPHKPFAPRSSLPTEAMPNSVLSMNSHILRSEIVILVFRLLCELAGCRWDACCGTFPGDCGPGVRGTRGGQVVEKEPLSVSLNSASAAFCTGATRSGCQPSHGSVDPYPARPVAGRLSPGGFLPAASPVFPESRVPKACFTSAVASPSRPELYDGKDTFIGERSRRTVTTDGTLD